MQTRQASATAKKKTPPSRRTAAKAQPTPSSVETASAQSPKIETAPPKPGPATRGRQVKSTDIISTAVPDVAPPAEPAPAPADPKAIDDAVATQVTSETKPTKTTRRVTKNTTATEPLSPMVGSAMKVVKRVIKRTVIRSVKRPKSGETAKVEESSEDNIMVEASHPKPAGKDAETTKNNEISVVYAENQVTDEVPKVENIEGDQDVNLNGSNVVESTKEQEVKGKEEESSMELVTKSPKEGDAAAGESKDSKPTRDKKVGGGAENEGLVKQQEPAATESEPLEDQKIGVGKENEALMEPQEWAATESIPLEDQRVGMGKENELLVEQQELVAEESKPLEDQRVGICEETEALVEQQELAASESKLLEDQKVGIGKENEELVEQPQDQMKTAEDKVETTHYKGDMGDCPNEEKTDFDGLLEEADDEKIEGITDQGIHSELDQEQFPEDEAQEQSEEVLEDEHKELNAAARERKSRKELEIFVGGLDRDVTEEDLKKVFQNAGEVVDVRLHKDPLTNKNKGYAFVRFANKEQVKQALSEMKNPVIRGKRCGIAPSEDNDSLFVGNICNTWTKEVIKQKLKDYGIEGVEKITLVADPKHEGLSRGFAFLEFSCYAEAMFAYKRLQKPDAIFGHPERTVKVAFAEPMREPDPEVMAQVKSVFVDGLPPQWDEGHVKEKFERFGEIANIVLARNMSTARRKDFGFVDFTTHEAAAACVKSANSMELVDGNLKVKVRARLSNPLPKTQAVKGGMAGGFLIARGSRDTHPRFGRGFRRGEHTLNRPNLQHDSGRGFRRGEHALNHPNLQHDWGRGFARGEHALNRPDLQHDRGFHPHGPGHSGEMGFANRHELDSAYAFHRSHYSKHEGRWGFRGAHQGSIGGPPLPNQPNFDRISHGGYGDNDSMRREPFPSEGGFNRPYLGRHTYDWNLYDIPGHGIKRPYSVRDQDPGYLEPSTRRPRFEYSDASASFHGNRYQDAFGADGGHFHQYYYGSDYDRGALQPFYGGYRPHGRGYY